ncbi:MAG: diguanylate cyclase [Pseudomonadota bacterium]
MNREPLPLRPDPGSGERRSSLGDLLLTSDRGQRRCMQAIMISAFVYFICICVLIYGARRGLFAPGPVTILGVLMAATTLGFYLVVRTGLNRRFAEATMTFPQAIMAQTLVACGYTLTGPIHAANLMLFGLVMTFGMFDMHVKYARIMAAYTISVTGIAMLWGWRSDPTVYPAELEILYFVLAVTVLSAISQLSVVLAKMRARLKRQKDELQLALEHIQDLATHDELTGLANRRHILELLEQHAQRYARGGPSFYVVMTDLDHFKRINDTHGHAVGDDALRSFARQAQAQLRNTDEIGRWGGEEFLLLMPETPPGDPNVGLERLRTALAESEASEHVAGLRVYFSAGLSRYRKGEAIAETIERADRAVYAAKAAGRNRTVAL